MAELYGETGALRTCGCRTGITEFCWLWVGNLSQIIRSCSSSSSHSDLSPYKIECCQFRSTHGESFPISWYVNSNAIARLFFFFLPLSEFLCNLRGSNLSMFFIPKLGSTDRFVGYLQDWFDDSSPPWLGRSEWEFGKGRLGTLKPWVIAKADSMNPCFFWCQSLGRSVCLKIFR